MKQVERSSCYLNNVVADFRGWLKNEGIRAFMFDVDDTICASQLVFKEQLKKCAQLLAEKNFLYDQKGWRKQIAVIDDEMREKYSIDIGRWKYVVEEFEKKYQFDKETLKEVLFNIHEIYNIPIEGLPEYREGLRFLQYCGTEIRFVTHANRAWTMKKYEWLGLDEFVDKKHVWTIDEKDKKSPEKWDEAMRHFGYCPKECAVVGDSPLSDINPTSELGVKHVFLVENVYAGWPPLNAELKCQPKRISKITDIPFVVSKCDIIYGKN